MHVVWKYIEDLNHYSRQCYLWQQFPSRLVLETTRAVERYIINVSTEQAKGLKQAKTKTPHLIGI